MYITKHNTKCFVVSFQNSECVRVLKFGAISTDGNTILYIKPLELFLGRSQACEMIAMSGNF